MPNDDGKTREFESEAADGFKSSQPSSNSDAIHVADRRWRSPDETAIRLNPVESANPAYRADPAFGRTGSGAYGGRGPRVEGARDVDARGAGAGTGRWVRTESSSVRWVRDAVESVNSSAEWRWRRVTVEAGSETKTNSVVPMRQGAFSYLENGDETVTLVEYEGDWLSVEVPPSIEGKPVAVLGANLFEGHAEMESVTIPDGVRAIDEHAFDGCRHLCEVDLPSSLEILGAFSFAKTGLASVLVPEAVQYIGEKAFFHCKRLLVVKLPLGLKRIGESAFAYSGVTGVYIPDSVEELGFNAFDMTPAQKHAGSGAISISPRNGFYRFDGAGLYRRDEFVELIGYVSCYSVRMGARRISEGACKRHPTIETMELPESLVEVGDDAFRSNRKLARVDLPESLVRIGAHAFSDTSLASLRISRNVREIGEGALLVQGENQMKQRSGLKRIDLDPENPVFYLENGLLCERDSSPGGGDTCLLYIGPDNVVRIPDEVTTIAVMAFGGADGVDELYVHDHIHSFCHGWLSTMRTVPRIHVDFASDIDGYRHGDFIPPSLNTRFRYPTDLFGSCDGKTLFNFAYYDSWVTCATDIGEFSEAAYERLRHPMGMTEHVRELYEGIFARKSMRVCRYFAERGNIEALEFLAERGLMGLTDIEAELESAVREGRGHATACLLEAKRRVGQADTGRIDFSL